MTIRAYSFQDTVCGFSGWVKAETRAKAKMIIARALEEAGWCKVGYAMPRIKRVRLDPRADEAPVCGRGPAGLVHAGWRPPYDVDPNLAFGPNLPSHA